MTSLSGTGSPRGAAELGRDAIHSGHLQHTSGPHSGVAHALLTCKRVVLCALSMGLRPQARRAAHRLGMSLVCLAASCLPPDFEIVPRENRPVSIDKALLTRSPDQYQDILEDCEPRVFDLTNSIIDPDENDPVTIAWLVDYAPGQSVEPDAINRLRFTFDPCTNPKAAAGKVSTVEAMVLDRSVPLDILADVDLLKEFADDDVTSDSVVWFVGFQECNDTRPECR